MFFKPMPQKDTPLELVIKHAIDVAKDRHDGTGASLIHEYVKAYRDIINQSGDTP